MTGVILGLVPKWGVFRHPWVTTKLLLVVSVMVGRLVLGPAIQVMLSGQRNVINSTRDLSVCPSRPSRGRALAPLLPLGKRDSHFI